MAVIDLYPDLRILFPTADVAFAFAYRAEDILEHIFVDQEDRIVTIAGADHPELRADLIAAAKLVHGDVIPSTRAS